MSNKFSSARLLEALSVTVKAAAESKWDQGVWVKEWECGTGGCFAGNWAIAQGCTPRWNEEDLPGGRSTPFIFTPEGRKRFVEDWVRDDLGLKGYEADALFDVDNDLEGLHFIVEEIIAGRES